MLNTVGTAASPCVVCANRLCYSLEAVAVIPFARPLEEQSYAVALRLAGFQSPISARAGELIGCSQPDQVVSIGPSVGKRARGGCLSSFIRSQFFPAQRRRSIFL